MIRGYNVVQIQEPKNLGSININISIVLFSQTQKFLFDKFVFFYYLSLASTHYCVVDDVDPVHATLCIVLKKYFITIL